MSLQFAGRKTFESDQTNWTLKPQVDTSSEVASLGNDVPDTLALADRSSISTALPAYDAGTEFAVGSLVFNNSFLAGVTPAYKAAILAAEADLGAHFTNPVTLQVSFDLQPLSGSLAASNHFFLVRVSYADLKSALTAHATSADQIAAVRSLPATDPSNGVGFQLAQGMATILGLIPAMTDTVTVHLNSNVAWQWGQDAIGAIEHEISEGAMGRFGGLGIDRATDGSPIWGPMDLFRYSAPGQRDYTGGSDGRPAFFSTDGSTMEAPFENPVPAGGTQRTGFDFADWGPPLSGDAFGRGGPYAPGVLSELDLRVMNILGWTRAPIDIAVHGIHSAYKVALDPGSGAVVVDTVPGRDGTQRVGSLHNIVFTDGVGRFDASGNAEEVARLYKTAFNRSPDAQGLDFWAAQLDSRTIGINDVALSFIGSTEFSQRYGSLDNVAFVGRLYQNVLGRAGDSAGIQYWANQLAVGTSRAQTLIGFSDSAENKDNTAASIGDKDRSEAYRLYIAALNRTPDKAGLDHWTGVLDSGGTPVQVAQGFVDTKEFAQAFAGLDASGFVNRLYQNVLHRPADANGAQFWIGQLNGGASKADVLLGFSDSLENRLNTANATHDAWVYLG